MGQLTLYPVVHQGLGTFSTNSSCPMTNCYLRYIMYTSSLIRYSNRVLLTETRVNANGKIIWTERTAHFQQNIHSYNNSVAFISLGANLQLIVLSPIL